jgi:L-rhamnose mutarotase
LLSIPAAGRAASGQDRVDDDGFKEGSAVPQRSAFVLRIRPDKVDEYTAAHARVWPELLAALRDAGIRNYSIFIAGSQAFGYFEADDLARAGEHLASQDVNRRWQDPMAELLEERVPDEGPPGLPEIFRLD